MLVMSIDEPGPTGQFMLMSIVKTVTMADAPEITVYILIMLLCLLISAICAGAENAFFSHRDSDVADLRDDKSAVSKMILSILERPKHLLATILLLNSLANVAFVLISILLTEKLFDLEALPWLKFFVEAIVVTIIVLVFGEVMPKVFATQHYRSSARFLVYPMRTFTWVLWPFTHLLVKFGSVLERTVKVRANELTPEELSRAIDMATDEDDAKQEKEILKGIVNMGTIQVKQIMRSRVDMTAVAKDVDFHKLLGVIREAGFSRMPVYDKTVDAIVGVLSIKSLIPHLDAGTDFAWQQFVKAPYFIPENKTIDDTLQEMRTNHNHLAIVVDEFGGTSGMITMEDILEEVFGDMQDEFDDDEEQAFVEMGNGVWVFEAKVLLVDFIRETELPIDMFDHLELESDSLGGMVSERLGRMPKRGDEVQVGKVRFRVESADMRRVKKIKITMEESHAGEE
jgi:gliding motility-associated protein GldE